MATIPNPFVVGLTATIGLTEDLLKLVDALAASRDHFSPLLVEFRVLLGEDDPSDIQVRLDRFVGGVESCHAIILLCGAKLSQYDESVLQILRIGSNATPGRLIALMKEPEAATIVPAAVRSVLADDTILRSFVSEPSAISVASVLSTLDELIRMQFQRLSGNRAAPASARDAEEPRHGRVDHALTSEKDTEAEESTKDEASDEADDKTPAERRLEKELQLESLRRGTSEKKGGLRPQSWGSRPRAEPGGPIQPAAQTVTPGKQGRPAPGTTYRVWFGTNRKPGEQVGGFLSERWDRITRGYVDVHIPAAHRVGETGSSFWRRLWRRDLRDDHLLVRGTVPLDGGEFYKRIRKAINAFQRKQQSTALIFLHGYNVSFDEAAIRAAQLGCDLKVQGATAFFSWPSSGTEWGYPADEACIEASEAFITDFLVEFATNCGANKVHLIAHSMGNRGLLRALHRVADRAEDAAKLKFDQIFLAAPDVDRDVFVDLARIFPKHARRTTLYASSSDFAVHLSKVIHVAPRAGYFPPYTVVSGIDTVEVPDFNVDLLGHSYFARAEALLHDIYDLMHHDSPPANRQRIESATDGTQAFWRLRR